MHPDDLQLLQCFHQPETREKGYTAIIHKYQEPLYWHIRRLVISHADADDVLQNVLLKVWKGLDSFREESNLYTWLYRIATNESLSFLAKEQRRESFNLNDAYVNPTLVDKLQAEPHFNEAQIEWKLQAAIQQLPDKQRLVFNMRYFDEMSYQMMSEVLQTSEGALKASYHHAVKKIAETMKQL